MAGLLPFGAVFIELFFIFNALWENQFYYLFGFLFLVFCILVISVSQISIVMVYFQLCGEVYIFMHICSYLQFYKSLPYRDLNSQQSRLQSTAVLMRHND